MAAKIAKTVGESQPYWPDSPRRPPGSNGKGAPNILIVLFDDVGFSDLGCYGSPIATPTIDALAKRGLRYTGFQTIEPQLQLNARIEKRESGANADVENSGATLAAEQASAMKLKLKIWAETNIQLPTSSLSDIS